jgi:hypothetical protein
MERVFAEADQLQRSVTGHRKLQQQLCDVFLGDELPLGPCRLDDSDLEPEMELDQQFNELGSEFFVSSSFGDSRKHFTGRRRSDRSPRDLLQSWARQLAVRNSAHHAVIGAAAPRGGCSVPSVVVNVFYCFLAQLERTRQAVPATTDTEGSALDFLVGRFVGHSTGASPPSSAQVDHYAGLPRLGGLFAAVSKESPLGLASVAHPSAAELYHLHVTFIVIRPLDWLRFTCVLRYRYGY